MSNAANSSGQFANDPAASQAGNPGLAGDVAEESETLHEEEELTPEADALRMLGGDDPADGQAGTHEQDDDEAAEDESGAAEESAEADASDEEQQEETEGEESDQEAEQAEGDESEESEKDAKDEEAKEGEESEEEDEHKVPPKLQARIDELTAARKSAEETLANERKLTAKLQEQVAMYEAARNDTFGLYAAADKAALDKRAAELEREADHYDRVLEQGYEKGEDGERIDLDPERQKLITGYVRDIRKAIARSVPARDRYFQERAQWDAMAVAEFPWLRDAKDPKTQYAQAILNRFPNLSPSVFAPAVYAAAVVSYYENDVVLKRKAGAKAQGAGAGKNGTATKAPGKAAAPVKKRPAAAVQRKEPENVDLESEQDAAAWVANQL